MTQPEFTFKNLRMLAEEPKNLNWNWTKRCFLVTKGKDKRKRSYKTRMIQSIKMLDIYIPSWQTWANSKSLRKSFDKKVCKRLQNYCYHIWQTEQIFEHWSCLSQWCLSDWVWVNDVYRIEFESMMSARLSLSQWCLPD